MLAPFDSYVSLALLLAVCWEQPVFCLKKAVAQEYSNISRPTLVPVP